MKVKVKQAIAMARNNESLEGLVIEDLQDTQVRAVDALALAEHGVLLPEQNIYYNDEDIAYDPDFDEVEWSKEPLKMSWEEKIQLAAQIEKNAANDEEISVVVKITDREVRQWMNKHGDKMGQILGNFIVDIYKASQIIKG
ncbi:hypothetical protein [Haliscomenobacter hydrossis]|uniref:Uncharacterized protein n=1 Tax=Haliscomenobacter hydrossis (strain ATCC 27775 / DSM 1100 / LMG 10767 / O) TaxID=760192 RepID=F4L5I5_HALH1|nr:hypothetical protein [Haliscomenobacter hydrossis]AEE50849.1 hypothetical protein Halhy_2985 [Haliscomenobacter hydrossis DSM 1100]